MKSLLNIALILLSSVLVGCNTTQELSFEETIVSQMIETINQHANEDQGKKARKLIKMCTGVEQANEMSVEDMDIKCYMNSIGYSSSDARLTGSTLIKNFAKNSVYEFVLANK